MLWDCQWNWVGPSAKSSYRVDGEIVFSDLSSVTKKTSVFNASIQNRPVCVLNAPTSFARPNPTRTSSRVYCRWRKSGQSSSVGFSSLPLGILRVKLRVTLHDYFTQPGYQTIRGSSSLRRYSHAASVIVFRLYFGRQPSRNLAFALSSQFE